jgi:rhomboid protease GluP
MNKSLIDQIINTFISHYGYSIFEYKNKYSDKLLWGIKKSQHCIVFGDLKEVFEIRDSINEWCLEIKNENLHLTYILLNDNNLSSEMIESIKSHIGYEQNQSTIIIVDRVELSILYYDPQVSDVAQAVQAVLASDRRRKDMNKKNTGITVTNIIIFINIVMYIITSYLSWNIWDANTEVLIFLGAKYNELIQKGEYYRLVTAMFLHGGILHIGLNMYVLKSIGTLIESTYGKLKFLLIYLLSGISSSLFSYFFSPAVSIGASGAIFGLMGAALIFGIKMRQKIGRDFLRSILQVILVNLILGFSISNIDNFGHLGGLIGGLVITSLFYVKSKGKEN